MDETPEGAINASSQFNSVNEQPPIGSGPAALLTQNKAAPQKTSLQKEPVIIDSEGSTPTTPAVNSFGLKTLRTYEGDLADAINKKQASAIKITIAENKKNSEHETIRTKTPSTTKNTFALVVSVAFIILGAGVLYYVYVYVLPHNTNTPAPIALAPTIIETDSQKELAVSSETIAAAIKNELTSSVVSPNSIENVRFTQAATNEAKPLTANEFLTWIGTHAPASLTRTFSSQFMFGIHSLEQNEPFILLKTDSYESAYAGMLKWEPEMYDDFKNSIIRENIDATSSPQLSSDILDAKTYATDMVIRNKDVRVIYDTNKNILLMYSFVDRNTIVITTNELTLREVISRMEKKIYVR